MATKKETEKELKNELTEMLGGELIGMIFREGESHYVRSISLQPANELEGGKLYLDWFSEKEKRVVRVEVT